MISTLTTLLSEVHPLILLGVGIAIGIATDEGGRALLRNFTQDNVDNILNE